MSKGIILIAEDDAEDRFIITEGFKSFDQQHCLKFVDHGKALLDMLTKQLAEQVMLIILDLNMPRMNGTETLRELKKIPDYRHIPVIIFSTSDNEIERSACFDLGVNDYRIKPSKFEEYLKLCHEFYFIAHEKAI